MNANGPLQEPRLRALLQQHRDEIFSSFNCVQLGTIVSYDPAKGSAQVRINAQRVVYNKPQGLDGKLQQTPQIVDYPPLDDVLVVVLGGGSAFLQMPIASGDECVLFFNDRDMDAWYATGAATAPNSSRMHSLSDAIALVGVKSLATARNNIGVDGAALVLGTSSIKILLDGSVVIDTKAKKVTVKNDSGALKAALDQLFSALTSWVDTHGDTPNPATIAAITAAKASVDAILA